MNKLSSSHRNLLIELLKYLKSEDVIVNTNIDSYLITRINDILRASIYTDDEKLLLNGLRELYLKTVEQVNDDDTLEPLVDPAIKIDGVEMW